jgi:hypothetical protein
MVFNRLSLSNDKTGFFITSRYPRVLSEEIKLYQGDPIFSLRSFSHESCPPPAGLSAFGVITRFEKKHYPWSD